MGRKKLLVKKIENPRSLQVTYSKRSDGLTKKASELSVLCDTDVGLLMFSPTGLLTSFVSSGRIEDILLRYIERPTELQRGFAEDLENLYQNLKHLKYEGEILKKLEKLQASEEKLKELNQRKNEAQEKMRSYNLDPEKITSVQEAQLHQQFLIDAILRIKQLKQAKLLKQIAPAGPSGVKSPSAAMNDTEVMNEESGPSEIERNPSSIN
ncbi:MADS-box family protein [Quillaja saponaria]|uniref:MADS-box family protein n=1 Tax=Quillaja saponaria TaxID=32244 RepID=A0AAD7KYM5_QUISA|nr:MADS-box family protein [Quillaja saponaria]